MVNLFANHLVRSETWPIDQLSQFPRGNSYISYNSFLTVKIYEKYRYPFNMKRRSFQLSVRTDEIK